MLDGQPEEVGGSRQRNRLQWEGAEHLVVARLLMSGVLAFKAPGGMDGFDVIATSPQHHSSCRIQVKCRWGDQSIGGFFISNWDCDFVVFVASHLGAKSRFDPAAAVAQPLVFVLPASDISSYVRNEETSPKIRLADIRDVDRYRENWGLIRTRLELMPSAKP